MEFIEFEGRRYPTVIVNLSFGDRKISNTDLNERLLTTDGSYVSEKARIIDESIFYFVEDRMLRFCENELSKLILSEI